MSKKTALKTMLTILLILLILHFLIILELIPYDKVWGGKLKSVEEMRTFESISILITIFMMSVLILKYKLKRSNKKNRLFDTIIWGFVVFFSLNTIGNLFSESNLELILGTLITLISATLCFIIVRKQ